METFNVSKGPENCSLQAESCPPGFVNKVLLELRLSAHVHSYIPIHTKMVLQSSYTVFYKARPSADASLATALLKGQHSCHL